MKIRGGRLILLLLLPVILSGLFSCSRENRKKAERLAELESPGYERGRTSDSRIAELEKDVALFRKKVDEKVQATEKLGSYYKLLALAYLDRDMFGPALEALDRAVEIYPDQPPLFLFRGIAAARLSKAVRNPEEKEMLLDTAEKAYQRAIHLDPGSIQALYGLAILYAFEMDRDRDALPLIERILDRERENVDALFLLGRVQYSLGRPEEALEAYDRIIGISAAGTRRDEARRNKQQILEEALR